MHTPILLPLLWIPKNPASKIAQTTNAIPINFCTETYLNENPFFPKCKLNYNSLMIHISDELISLNVSSSPWCSDQSRKKKSRVVAPQDIIRIQRCLITIMRDKKPTIFNCIHNLNWKIFRLYLISLFTQAPYSVFQNPSRVGFLHSRD